jgi:hypothetical protein
MRKALFERIKAGGKGGNPGQWSARKAQMLAQQYRRRLSNIEDFRLKTIPFIPGQDWVMLLVG